MLIATFRDIGMPGGELDSGLTPARHEPRWGG
jgi:hypothetical protein